MRTTEETPGRAGPRAGPVHHVPAEELLDYVAGRQGEAAALAIACHVALCPACRDEARGLEGIGGALLDTARPASMSAGGLERALERLQAPAVETVPDKAAAGAWPEGERLGVPGAVGALLAPRLPAGTTHWRYIAPGIRGVNVSLAKTEEETGTVRVVRLRPGLVIPQHGHRTTELTLVLTGALTDAVGRFARGDLSVRRPGDTHIQRVDDARECLALVINGDGLIPMTWTGRLVRWIARP